MAFESFIHHIEGIIYQVLVNLFVSKLADIRLQESVNISYISKSRSAIRSGGRQVREFSDDGGLFGHIFLSRRLRVIRRIFGIMFTFQTDFESAADFYSVGVPLQFVFVSW